MKNILLATSALLLAATVSAYAGEAVSDAQQSAKGAEVKLFGQGSFDYLFFNNKDVKEANDVGYGGGMLAQVNKTKFGATASGKTDAGMNYGLTMIFSADKSASNHVKEAFVFMENSYGSAYLGDRAGVEDKMAVGGFIVATELDDAVYEDVFAATTGSYTSISLFGTTDEATKVTVMTPTWKGFQFGLSFTPKSDRNGEATVNSIANPTSDGDRPFTTNNVAAGLTYENKFANGVSLTLSATGIYAKQKNEEDEAMATTGVDDSTNVVSIDRENVRSYALGALIGYQNWEFGAEYLDNGKSAQFKNFGSKAPTAYDFGLAYNFGSVKLALGYYHAERKMDYATKTADGVDVPTFTDIESVDGKAKTDIFTVSAHKKLAPGLAVYVAYDHIKTSNPNAEYEAALLKNLAQGYADEAIANNKAQVVRTGVQVKF